MVSLFPSEDERRIAEKRRRLARIIAENSRAKLRLLAENPTIDVDPRAFERTSNRKQLERDLARASEEHLDTLLAFHDPRSAGSAGFVW